MGAPYLLRVIIFLLILMLGLFVRADIDVEEQIRRAEDPNYDQYLVEIAKEHRQELKDAEDQIHYRNLQEKEEEAARAEYAEWRHRQKEVDMSREEVAYQKDL